VAPYLFASRALSPRWSEWQDDEIGAVEPVLEAVGMLRIAGPERVDQHALAGNLEMKGRMAEPSQ
jgi:hypothetical protein